MHASFSYSIQCPFLMEALPLLELIHGHFMWFAYPASRETHNIARIKSRYCCMTKKFVFHAANQDFQTFALWTKAQSSHDGCAEQTSRSASHNNNISNNGRRPHYLSTKRCSTNEAKVIKSKFRKTTRSSTFYRSVGLLRCGASICLKKKAQTLAPTF